ncbi:MAG: undecaprenyl/decaprenyl-phosphate alpha-N-acetylglucosaminyl 1-phosphate transferase [Bacteroidetes bacterium]|nr:undecaprenyl/decaprenyl-phosphate alpha-N-acetylglucosaminyl 1-phosphate transferase [Bacteroidota bacterium]
MEHLILAFLTSFFVVLLVTPSLIKVAFLKRLFDEPGEARKLHKRVVPTIGGIIIFAATVFAVSLWFPNGINQYDGLIRGVKDFQYVVATLLMLFFVGIKDDIVGTAPIKKLAAHIIVGMILVLMAEIRIRSLHGLFGIYDIPLWASIFLSLFTYIVVVNAFNLIDGVDGLASGVGLIASAAFGTIFMLGGDLVMALLSFSLAGSLAAFLFFNFSPAKIFMGDSGSLSIGLIMSILAIKLVEFVPQENTPLVIKELVSPVTVLAILVYPLTDTLRIFIYRAIKGISPFSADRNHLHHLLIDSGFSHKSTVISIYSGTLAVMGVAFGTRLLDETTAFIITGTASILLMLTPIFIKRRHNKKQAQLKPKTRQLTSVEAA